MAQQQSRCRWCHFRLEAANEHVRRYQPAVRWLTRYRLTWYCRTSPTGYHEPTEPIDQ